MANFCTLNPLAQYDITLSEGNLKATPGSSGGARFYGTHYMTSGKWYCEFLVTLRSNYHHYGIHAYGDRGYAITEDANNGRVIVRDDGPVYIDGGQSTTVSSFTTGDVIGIAVDMDNGKLYFYKNNTNISGSGHNITGYQTRAYTFHGLYNANAGSTKCNFGQFPWRYDPPSGFVALSTENLAEPAISNFAAEKPEDHFNTVLYTGNGTSQSISLGFQPDLLWIKDRSSGLGNIIFDSVRGTDKFIFSQDTAAEATGSGILNSFDSNGFSIGSNGHVNNNSSPFVAWCWKAGGAAVSNTDGSITSQVSANQDAGFSIVSFTGTGGNATVGHGLGAVPKFIVVKNRTATNSWPVHHVSCTSGNVYLNSTNAQGAGKDVNSSSTTTFSLTTWDAANGGNNPMIAYCWAEIEGYSSIGNYTGNGSTDGPFVYTGFKPALVIRKAYSTTENWSLVDNERNTYNPVTYFLRSDEGSSDSTGAANVDFLADGFKIRSSDPKTNGSGVSYLYVAFADSPFKYSSAR